MAYYSSDVEYDFDPAEQLASESIATRSDSPVPGEPVTLSAEMAMWYPALSRGDFDAAVQWGMRQYERGRHRQDIGNIVFGLGTSVLAWSFQGRGVEARNAADELERHLGPDPDPLPAWALSFARGMAWAEDDPHLAVEHFERGSEAALAGGLSFFVHLGQRDTSPVSSGHLAPAQAAIAARDVLVDMWEDRVIFNMRGHVAHIMVVCVRAARLREAAVIDGWLGADALPLHPTMSPASSSPVTTSTLISATTQPASDRKARLGRRPRSWSTCSRR